MEEKSLNKRQKKSQARKKSATTPDTFDNIPQEKNTFEQTLAEPAVSMQSETSINVMQNWKVLKEAANKPESLMTSFEKIGMIKEGISKKDLENLKEKAGFDYYQLSKVLSVARATLINKKGNDKFDVGLSEKIVSVADIYSYGYEVFEDETRFNDWIFRSNQALGGRSPYNLLDNQYGREEIKNLIGRIDYGVYS